MVKLRFLGTGDASASGGRFYTCFYVETSNVKFLIDCGASALISMKKYKIPHTDLDAILLTHFHGDHFTGIPFLIIDIRLYNRTKPLHIAGPPGVEEKITDAMELFYPGSSKLVPAGFKRGKENVFPIIFHEYDRYELVLLDKINVKPFKVKHSPETKPHGLRVEVEGKVIVYSGDTEWTDNLIEASEGADIFICECSFYDVKTENHLDYQTLLKNKNKLNCKRLILTHAGEKMLGESLHLEDKIAVDGEQIIL
jgi:ribonuclease BN (tRNA processing enzyme)